MTEPQNLTQKLIAAHLVSGEMTPGAEIAIKIDQTLTQDSTGTMAYLQLEAMGVEQVKTELSVAYVDHNMLQEGFENADDHLYIRSCAARHGIYFSKPGNGICHQVHLERFGVPGKSLLGSDSHTPTGGGIGMLAIGAGGLDVAVAMGGGAYCLNMPLVTQIRLSGHLRPFVSAKDVILEILRRLTVKGGVGRIIEYTGNGVSSLSVPDRATITNMGTELGATTSVFPSDDTTRAFLAAQGRQGAFVPLCADEGARYDETIELNLAEIVPMTALPHSPDNVKTVAEAAGIRVDQVVIGSCTNSSLSDMMRAAAILKGHTVPAQVSLVIAPGSRQVLSMLAQNGALADMLAAGARVLETGCGPCIGMGQAPATGAVSLRTINRNFKGRCGTVSAGVYIVSPETAAASALAGVLTDPTALAESVALPTVMPDSFAVNDNMIIAPDPDCEVIKGPNIKPFPVGTAPCGDISGKVLIKLGDNITTDHIMPSNAKLLPFRSNIPHLADYCLTPCDPDFPARAVKEGGGIIIAGENYGQGSSREHAALVPLYLKVRAVAAKSFARIHRANLINSGILPLQFRSPADYDALCEGDELCIEDAPAQIRAEQLTATVKNSGRKIAFDLPLTEAERKTLLAGGKINMIKQESTK